MPLPVSDRVLSSTGCRSVSSSIIAAVPAWSLSITPAGTFTAAMVAVKVSSSSMRASSIVGTARVALLSPASITTWTSSCTL